MRTHAERVLEFDRLLQLLAGRTQSQPGSRLAAELSPRLSRAEVEISLEEIEELRRLRAAGQAAPSVGGLVDLQQLLLDLQPEGASLPAEGLQQVMLCCGVAADCRRQLGKAELAPRWAALAGQLNPLKELHRNLQRAIGPRGEILDSASAELAGLRREIRHLRNRLQARLERLFTDSSLAPAFQEQLVTTRNDRYVLPVRADRKGLINGFVQDESASGQTLYVEPVAVLEQNNQLRHQRKAEQQECERILHRLSCQVRAESSALLQNQELLARLDLRSAAARLADEIDARPPRLLDRPEIDLRQARHPLLLFDNQQQIRAEAAVPIDLRLQDTGRTLLISGPNTGGKTVALKTAGLLQLMLAAGLPLPCAEGSGIYLFDAVFADIGDEQSIAEELSTFSAHLGNIRRILAAAGDGSLVLLDELGTGTDPAEGGALGIAVLERLVLSGARTIATTHLSMIKGAAQLRDGMVNAAVEFDRLTLAPTFRLHYGMPGASGALTIARRLQLPEEVVANAERLLDPAQQEGDRLLQELTELQRQARLDREEADRLRQEARRERDRRRVLLHQFEDQRRTLLEKARTRAEQIVRQTEAELKQLLAGARNQGDDLAAGAELTRQLRQLGGKANATLQTPQPGLPVAREVALGELVQHRKLGTTGEVVKLSGKNIELVLGGKRLRCRLADLANHEPRRFRTERGATRVHSEAADEAFEPRLLLIGARVDEACSRLERFIDHALRLHLPEVEVVHGGGEGILRRAVRDYLRDHRGVSAFHAADIPYGGDNVTVVKLAS